MSTPAESSKNPNSSDSSLNSTSKSLPQSEPKVLRSDSLPAADGRCATSETGGCPMKRSDGSYSFDWSTLWRRDFPHGPGGSKPLNPQTDLQVPVSSSTGGCPVKHQEYNVYSQPIDPSNQMPTANQLPAPQQYKPLSTTRVISIFP